MQDEASTGCSFTKDGLGVQEIGRSLVNGHWVTGRNNPDIRDNGCIRKGVAIAGRGDLGEEVDEKRMLLLPLERSHRVFYHSFHKAGQVDFKVDPQCSFGTGMDACCAADTKLRVNTYQFFSFLTGPRRLGRALGEGDGAMGAVFQACSTPDALLGDRSGEPFPNAEPSFPGARPIPYRGF